MIFYLEQKSTSNNSLTGESWVMICFGFISEGQKLIACKTTGKTYQLVKQCRTKVMWLKVKLQVENLIDMQSARNGDIIIINLYFYRT